MLTVIVATGFVNAGAAWDEDTPSATECGRQRPVTRMRSRRQWGLGRSDMIPPFQRT